MFLLRNNMWTLKICILFPITVYCFCSMKNDVLLKVKLKNIIFRPCRTNYRIRSSRLIASGEIVKRSRPQGAPLLQGPGELHDLRPRGPHGAGG
jgi:hypothetical protein